MRFSLMECERRAAEGIIRLKIYQGGRCIRTERMRNLIVAGAAQMKANLLAGDKTGDYAIGQIGFGSSGAPAQESNTTLTTPFLKATDRVAVDASGALVVSFSLASTEANGLSLYELGLLSTSGILFARKVRDLPLLKESDLSLTGTWTITF